MCPNITNCIQKTWTKSGNMVIFGTNILTHPNAKGPNSKPTHKFIVFKRGLT